jgi:hypothetical protein
VFQTIQNKLHFAATGKTAAELIAERADAAKPNMGLTSWKSDVVRKGDVTIAKNYLQQDEIEELNRPVRARSRAKTPTKRRLRSTGVSASVAGLRSKIRRRGRESGAWKT